MIWYHDDNCLAFCSVMIEFYTDYIDSASSVYILDVLSQRDFLKLHFKTGKQILVLLWHLLDTRKLPIYQQPTLNFNEALSNRGLTAVVKDATEATTMQQFKMGRAGWICCVLKQIANSIWTDIYIIYSTQWCHMSATVSRIIRELAGFF